ncbi:MAG TPA: hypothetical protein VFH60_00180, partial [Chloroflexia bacterium]|nr:hypothetical protein [Chloroflexia bacterium]
ITGRKVITWQQLGSYGMGGPGFFGLELAARGRYPREWLVLTLWGAGGWLLLDGRWLEAHPSQYHIQRPLFSNFGGTEEWDELTGRLAGAKVLEARITDSSSLIVLRQGSQQRILEVPEDTTRLSVWGGSLEQKVWNHAESHLDAWVVSRRGNLFTG